MRAPSCEETNSSQRGSFRKSNLMVRKVLPGRCNLWTIMISQSELSVGQISDLWYGGRKQVHQAEVDIHRSMMEESNLSRSQ